MGEAITILSHIWIYEYTSCISSWIAQLSFSQQNLQSMHGDILHLYAFTIWLSPFRAFTSFSTSDAVSPFALGDPFSISVFIIVHFPLMTSAFPMHSTYPPNIYIWIFFDEYCNGKPDLLRFALYFLDSYLHDLFKKKQIIKGRVVNSKSTSASSDQTVQWFSGSSGSFIAIKQTHFSSNFTQ